MGFGSSTPLARPVSSRRCKSNTARSRPVTNGATLIPHLYVSSHSSSSTLFSWCYGSERRILRLFCFVRFPFLFSLSRILACEPFNTRFLCLRLHIVALPSSLFRPSRPLSIGWICTCLYLGHCEQKAKTRSGLINYDPIPCPLDEIDVLYCRSCRTRQSGCCRIEGSQRGNVLYHSVPC
ncbi:hypothetical protein BDV35DRAFT_41914 [Aspergillus flavus]|uniref:Uncharacterized protein n=1 Tax=Aspergillus flavus TaxID=5059 RepID=A0A5N6GKK7_ASPFL|nr:hypothetical protein BDV35DRAFT_41914 [Aspergillus flavus]